MRNQEAQLALWEPQRTSMWWQVSARLSRQPGKPGARYVLRTVAEQ